MGFSLSGILKGAASGFTASGGNPWGAVVGGAMGAYGEHQENSAAKKATKQSQDWWKYQFNSANDFTREQMQNRIQWSVQDALKAGINPAVAAGAPSNVTGSAMPNSDLYGGINARANTINAMANESNAQTANHAMRSQTMLNESNAYKNYTEAGLMDRNTAAKEIQAHAAEMQAYARAEEVDAVINRINALLPGEIKGQAMELALKAQQGRLNESELKYLDSVGLTKSQMIMLGNIVTDTLSSNLNQMFNRRNDYNISAERNTSMEKTFKPRDYNVEHFNNKGQFTSGSKYHYWN